MTYSVAGVYEAVAEFALLFRMSSRRASRFDDPSLDSLLVRRIPRAMTLQLALGLYFHLAWALNQIVDRHFFGRIGHSQCRIR